MRAHGHLAAVGVLAALLTLTACAQPVPGQTGAAPAPRADAAAADAPGTAAADIPCSRFPASLVAAAVHPMVPTADVAPSDAGQGPADGRICAFTVATPGTDLDSADRGLAQVTITVQDVWEQAPLTGKGDLARQQQGFHDSSRSARTSSGQTENDAHFTYSDVTGVGDGAYLEDTEHRADDGTITQYNDAVSVLRHPRPFRLDVVLDYVRPQPDQDLPDRSLDQLLGDAHQRAVLTEAIAKAVVGAVPGSS